MRGQSSRLYSKRYPFCAASSNGTRWRGLTEMTDHSARAVGETGHARMSSPSTSPWGSAVTAMSEPDYTVARTNRPDYAKAVEDAYQAMTSGPLWTDDDVTRATDALRRSRFIGCDCCAEYPTCRHGESHWCETCDEAGDHPPGRLEALAQEVLDAVLPAYRKRVLDEALTRLIRSLSYEVGEQGMRDAIAIVKTMYDEETP